MKCPHCEYEEFSRDENDKLVVNQEGEFYYLPIKMEQDSYDKSRRTVVGCPKCYKIFMTGN